MFGAGIWRVLKLVLWAGALASFMPFQCVGTPGRLGGTSGGEKVKSSVEGQGNMFMPNELVDPYLQ